MKREWIVALLVFSLLTGILGAYKARTWILGHADNAFIVDLADNIAHTGKPMSQVSASVKDFFDRVLGKSATDVCSMPFREPDPPKFNYFKWHPYVILYIVAPLHWLVSPVIGLSALTALSFVSLLTGVYWVARRENMPIPAASLLTLFAASLPVWSYGIQGQIYVDRFIIGLGFWFMIWLKYLRSKTWLGLALAVSITSLSDRYGLMVGSIIVGYFILFPRVFKWKEDRKWLVVAGLGAVATIAVIKFYVEYTITSSFLGGISFQQLIQKIILPDANMRVFLTLNFGVIGLLAIAAPRFYLLGIGLLLPNLLGTIGGAEKTGFATHYHSMYFPVLAFALALGAARWQKLLGTKGRSVVAFGLILGILFNLGIWRSNSEFTWSVAQLKNNSLLQPWYDLQSTFDGSLASSVSTREQANAAIPAGSKVVTPEMFMPAMLKGHEVHLFPVALEDGDYLVLQRAGSAEGPDAYIGAISYHGEADRKTQDACLQARAKELGYDFAKVQIIGEAAIIPRVRE